MLTQYGKLVRKHRIDKSMTLRQMAAALGVTPSFLSATETGRRSVPSDFLTRVASALNLDMAERAELEKAAEASRLDVRVRFGKDASGADREIAAMFARQFSELSEDEKGQIRKILERWP